MPYGYLKIREQNTLPLYHFVLVLQFRLISLDIKTSLWQRTLSGPVNEEVDEGTILSPASLSFLSPEQVILQVSCGVRPQRLVYGFLLKQTTHVELLAVTTPPSLVIIHNVRHFPSRYRSCCLLNYQCNEITSISLFYLHRFLGRSDFKEIYGVNGEMLDLVHVSHTKPPSPSLTSLLITRWNYDRSAAPGPSGLIQLQYLAAGSSRGCGNSLVNSLLPCCFEFMKKRLYQPLDGLTTRRGVKGILGHCGKFQIQSKQSIMNPHVPFTQLQESAILDPSIPLYTSHS